MDEDIPNDCDPAVYSPDSSLQTCRPFSFPRLVRSNDTGNALQTSNHAQVQVTVLASDDRDASSNKVNLTPLPPNTSEPHVNRTMDLLQLRIDDIVVGERLRGVIEPFISTMVSSISGNDLIQPPVVRPDPINAGQYRLVCGLQRVNAERARGNDTILCRVVSLNDTEATLWEIDENLVRAPLSPAEEALFVDHRRILHEQLYGKSKARGAVAANAAMGRHNATAKLADASFATETARKTGRSVRAIQRLVSRAVANGHSDLARVAGTSLDKPAELDALPRLDPVVREKLIEEARKGVTVSAVGAQKGRDLSSVEVPRMQANPHFQSLAEGEIDLSALSLLKQGWLAASPTERSIFLSWIDDHVA